VSVQVSAEGREEVNMWRERLKMRLRATSCARAGGLRLQALLHLCCISVAALLQRRAVPVQQAPAASFGENKVRERRSVRQAER
jgi:hypothetical protein